MLETDQLDTLIGNWLVTAKKEDGENFEPDPLTALHRDLDRHPIKESYSHSISVSPLFETSRKVCIDILRYLPYVKIYNYAFQVF